MNFITSKIRLVLFLTLSVPMTAIYAETSISYLKSARQNFTQLFSPNSTDINRVSIQALRDASWNGQETQDTLRIIQASTVQRSLDSLAKI